MALHYPTRRLDPPATAILDELPNATPIPQLPDIISDSAGRGVVIHWAAQSAAQLEDTFTPARARQLLDNSTTMTFWGGTKDARTLDWISTLAGHHEALRWQHHTDGPARPRPVRASAPKPCRPTDPATCAPSRRAGSWSSTPTCHRSTPAPSTCPPDPTGRNYAPTSTPSAAATSTVDTAGFAIPAHRAGFQPPPILHT